MTPKRLGKQDRERKVLFGLVDYYIRTGKPVGSNTLKEAGFEDLSSATIRNYFAHLEQEGYLIQSHSSGGRIPTQLAYRTYAEDCSLTEKEEKNSDLFQALKQFDSREVALFLQEAAEQLSQVSQCAIFLAAPRFDHDYITEIKFISLSASRGLCILISDFGVVHTEILYLPSKLSSFAIKRIENYFHWRLTGVDEPEHLEADEEKIAQTFYHELMLRYIVGYSNFSDVDIYRTGFSRLLHHSDFQEANVLASSLSLFENLQGMRCLLKECKTLDRLKFWIGDDLVSHVPSPPNCSVLAIPYYIHSKAVGAVGLLGPMRLPYRKLFHLLDLFSNCVSESLTRMVYKFKISFRQPERGALSLQKEERRFLEQPPLFLLEDQRTPSSLNSRGEI